MHILHYWHLVAKGVGDQGITSGNDSGGCNLEDTVKLSKQLLGQVASQVGKCPGARTDTTPKHLVPERHQVAICWVHGTLQVHSPTTNDPHATIVMET